MEELSVLHMLKVLMFWLSPVIFIEGLLLLLSINNYNKLEEFLKKEIGGMKNKPASKLEANHYVLHEWLLKRRFLVGFICLLYSTIVFFVLLENLYRQLKI